MFVHATTYNMFLLKHTSKYLSQEIESVLATEFMSLYYFTNATESSKSVVMIILLFLI
jgi:hypothetical protein